MRCGNSDFKFKQNTIISQPIKQYGFEGNQNSGGIRLLMLLKAKYELIIPVNATETVELDDSLSFDSH
jgi:hypothetical protein